MTARDSSDRPTKPKLAGWMPAAREIPQSTAVTVVSLIFLAGCRANQSITMEEMLASTYRIELDLGGKLHMSLVSDACSTRADAVHDSLWSRPAY